MKQRVVITQGRLACSKCLTVQLWSELTARVLLTLETSACATCFVSFRTLIVTAELAVDMSGFLSGEWFSFARLLKPSCDNAIVDFIIIYHLYSEAPSAVAGCCCWVRASHQGPGHLRLCQPHGRVSARCRLTPGRCPITVTNICFAVLPVVPCVRRSSRTFEMASSKAPKDLQAWEVTNADVRTVRNGGISGRDAISRLPLSFWVSPSDTSISS